MARILAVVTLVSPNGEYGGPLRVAVNQAKALIDRGHDVTIVGGTSGFADVPEEIEGVPVRLFDVRRVIPRTGFAGLTAPRLMWWLLTHGSHYDVVHLHLARDLVTLPAGYVIRGRRIRYFLQPHGMIDHSDRKLATVLDALLTRRVLRSATEIFYLTPRERDDLLTVDPTLSSLVELPNGVPRSEPCATPEASPREVLYLARLADRKRPTAFVRVAARLAEEFHDVTFSMVGPDEGEGPAVQEAIRRSNRPTQIRWEGPLRPDETVARMRRASIYVLPAVNEPYPMTVLEAMSVGLPVVVTQSCGLAELVQRSGGGFVVEEDEESLFAAVRTLLADSQTALDMGERAKAAVSFERSMDSVVNQLEKSYATTPNG